MAPSALLIYSDPQGDGYVRGDVYPEGPMRNWNGVQRGSVMNGAGDPATPGYASTRVRAATREPARMDIPHIPVVPISYGERERAARRPARARRPERLAGRTPVPLSRRPGPGSRARPGDGRSRDATGRSRSTTPSASFAAASFPTSW